MGSLETASPFYRIFCTIALLAVSFFIITSIQMLHWKHHPKIIFFLSLLESGLIGNGIDKLCYRKVIDYIPISLHSSTIFFNLADGYQWLGGFGLLYLIWKRPEQFWPKQNLRNQLLSFPRAQLKIISTLLIMMSLVSMSYFSLWVAYLKTNQIEVNLFELFICFFIFYAFIILIVFIFGLYWTQRIYGPFRAIERHLLAYLSNPSHEIRLRTSDENEIVLGIIKLMIKVNKK